MTMGEANVAEPQGLSPTAYDDAFRTLLDDLRKWLIPMVNKFFGENYSLEEKITAVKNEHMISLQENARKVITDGAFRIGGPDGKIYIIECQSTPDNSMSVRLFEYATQIALDERNRDGKGIEFTIPDAGVLYLREPDKMPDSLPVVLHTPGGTVEYDMPVLKTQEYSIEKILNEDLLFILPFHSFSHEKEFEACEKMEDLSPELKAEYGNILPILEELKETGKITSFERRTLENMTKLVFNKLTADKYPIVNREVNKIMGGRVIEHEGRAIYRDGIAQGRKEGLEEGLEKGLEKGRKEGYEEGRNERILEYETQLEQMQQSFEDERNKMLYFMFAQGKSAKLVAEWTGVKLAEVEKSRQYYIKNKAVLNKRYGIQSKNYGP